MAVQTSDPAARDNKLNLAPPTYNWSHEHTRILPETFEAFDLDSTLNVLDAGPAEPLTINYLRRFRCQLYVADLFNPAVPGRDLDSVTEFLGMVGDIRFDVCLLWDFINYPDNEGFADFVLALSDHVHEKTRLYAIGAYSAQLPLKAYRYAIADADRLAIRATGGVVPRPRSRNDVTRAMRRYVVHRSALRRDNRLELLMRTTSETWR